jgi:hypothetical protein
VRVVPSDGPIVRIHVQRRSDVERASFAYILTVRIGEIMSLEGTALLINTEYVCVTCTCGLIFAVPADVRQRWRDTGASFNCPMGHPLSYTESEVGKLRKQLEREKQNGEWYKRNAASEREARERTQRQLRATKGAKTRMANRVKNGVCPCCNRTFMNLQQHMKTQHPAFNTPADKAESHG